MRRGHWYILALMWDRLPTRGGPALGTLGERAASGRAVESWRDLTLNRVDPCSWKAILQQEAPYGSKGSKATVGWRRSPKSSGEQPQQ